MKILFRAFLFLALAAVLPAWTQDRNSLESLADQILEGIVEIRGLKLLHPVPKGVLSREAIEKAFRKRIQEDYLVEDLEQERRLLVKLGVLPLDYDYVEGTMKVLNEQVAGYYDPKEKTLFIADWLPPEVQQMTMAHELTHALQDQHYELEAILSDSDHDADALLARRAVVEGDAVAVMFDYLLGPLQRSFVALPNVKDLYEKTLQQQMGSENGMRQLQEAPPFIRDSLLFPYIYGARFIQVFRKEYSWPEADQLYAHLPTSTEQIMHPEKYLEQHDDPALQDNPIDALLMAWDIDYSDVLGEFQTYLTLRQFLPDEEARKAAAGWDGDQVRLLQDDKGRLALQWDSTWDSTAEAKEFRDFYAKLVRLKYKLKEPTAGPSGNLSWESDFDRIQIRLSDLAVRILEVEKVPVRRGE